ncbi:hypothetical protein V6N12_048994 [Hibiscus sabdariffa]|uniref:RNase H type-1 domain-containing protein n=1 Tax=Hibiscus sabdariffa TaxID=183260 RepID=A0ABR2EIX4_9ROSI
MAIKEALITFSSFDRDKEITLQVECDCSNVLSWLRQPSLPPFAFKDLVAQSLGLTRNLKWELLLVNREMNTRADRLAKAGIEGDPVLMLLILSCVGEVGKWMQQKKKGKVVAQQASGREGSDWWEDPNPIDELNPEELEEVDFRYAEFFKEHYITRNKKITTSTSMSTPKDPA